MEVIICEVNIQVQALISSIGLILDIIGAIIIYKFGLPENVDRSGTTYLISDEVDKNEKDKAKKYDRNSSWGISFLIIGFMLQGISNWV